MGEKFGKRRKKRSDAGKKGSFGAMLDAGKPKEEIMEHFSMNEYEYNKVLSSLEKIRNGKSEEKR